MGKKRNSVKSVTKSRILTKCTERKAVSTDMGSLEQRAVWEEKE